MNRNSLLHRGWLRHGLKLLTCAAAAALLVGPTSAVAQKVQVKGVINVAEDINPNRDGRPSPLRVVLYQLAAADAFNEADFTALYYDEGAALGGDVLDRREMMLRPGQTIEIEEEFDPETGFLGIVAAFRDQQQAQWRSIVELEAKGFISLRRNNRLTINVSELAVEAIVE